MILNIVLVCCYSVKKSEDKKVDEKPAETISFENSKKIEINIDKDTNKIDELEADIINRDNGLPRYISGLDIRLEDMNKESSQLALDYLDKIKKHLKIKDAHEEFYLNSVNKDNYGEEHIRLNQRYKGVDVFGSGVIVHLKDKKFIMFNGNYIATPNIDVNPKISSKKAVKISRDYISKQTKSKISDNNPLLEFVGDKTTFEPKLVIYNKGNKNNLSWQITVFTEDNDEYRLFVSAIDGRIIDYYNNKHSCYDEHLEDDVSVEDDSKLERVKHNDLKDYENYDFRTMANYPIKLKDLDGKERDLNIFNFSGTTKYIAIDATKPMSTKKPTLVGKRISSGTGNIVGLKKIKNRYKHFLNSTGTSFSDTFTDTIVSAMYSSSKTYDYFYNTHGLKNIFGASTNLYVTVENAVKSAYYLPQTNMIVLPKTKQGDSYAKLDVIAHEITHGIVEDRINLIYFGQSGAINEALADIFGAMVDRDDWSIGEELKMGVIRNIKDPKPKNPDHMDLYKVLPISKDRAGVHHNSTIVSHAFYKFTNYSGIGKLKAEKIFYDAMNYLVLLSDFVDMRIACEKSARKIYGDKVAFKVSQAFDEVGIYVDRNLYDRRKGDAYILYYNTDPSKAGTFYYRKTDKIRISATATKLSQTPSKHMPSIDDAGKYAYFVNNAGDIKRIDLVNNKEEAVNIPSGGAYINPVSGLDYASISKDGDKIAYSKGNKFCFYSFGHKKRKCFNITNVTKINKIEWDNKSERVFVEFNIKDKNLSRGTSIITYRILLWNNKTKDFFAKAISRVYLLNKTSKTGKKIYFDLGAPSYSSTEDVLSFKIKETTSSSYDPFIIYDDIKQYKFLNFKNPIKRGANNISDINSSYFRFENRIDYKRDDHIVYSYSINGKDTVRMFYSEKDGVPVGAYLPEYTIAKAKWAVAFRKQSSLRKIMSSDNKMNHFGFYEGNNDYKGVIDNNNNTINVEVDKGVDLKKLKAYFISSKYSDVMVGDVLQKSGITINDFSKPLIYSVYAEDGTKRDYTVTVRHKYSNEKEITKFSIERSLNSGLNKDYEGVIDNTNGTIKIDGYEKKDLKDIIATFSYSGKSVKVNNVLQESSKTKNDFSSPLTYRVYAENGTYKDYNVIINVKGVTLSDKKQITSFSIEMSLNSGLTRDYQGVIDDKNATIRINDYEKGDIKNIVATFTHSGKSVKVNNVLQESGKTKNDFSSPLTYRVYAEDGTYKDYYIILNVKGVVLSDKKQITSFRIKMSLNSGLTKDYEGIIDDRNGTININDYENKDLKNIVATFNYSGKSVRVNNVLQESSKTSNNFTNSLTYRVYAEDGTYKDYKVSINKSSKVGISDDKQFYIIKNPIIRGEENIIIKIGEENINNISVNIFSLGGGSAFSNKYSKKDIINGKVEISSTKLKKGIYIVRISSLDGSNKDSKTYIKKILVI